MAEATSNAGYDVFLCHNSTDKPQVRELAALLRERKLHVFLDEDDIPSGPWLDALEAAILNSKAALILCGPSPLRPAARHEARAFIAEFFRLR